MDVELPQSFISLRARVLRGTDEIESSSCLRQSEGSRYEPLSSAKHMIIQRQIALIIGTISGFEQPLQGPTMLGEIIWKDEKEEIIGIEKIMPCRFGSLPEKINIQLQNASKRGGGARCQPSSRGLMRYTAVLCGPWAVYLCWAVQAAVVSSGWESTEKEQARSFLQPRRALAFFLTLESETLLSA